jgi:hypothetical protein
MKGSKEWPQGNDVPEIGKCGLTGQAVCPRWVNAGLLGFASERPSAGHSNEKPRLMGITERGKYKVLEAW